ncbi:unnamed protein product [Cylindrotheca closterium]|uniref:Uncharacterized protein n=1 Tax=Cylindrotheca closterium TaxID=2856 RepID=A0AAD2PVB8_9STRA|nr:unnamed protein product [Cylindrotheca closterium]
MDETKQQQSSPSPAYTQSSLNRLLYDPPRWGWSAVGGIADLLTPHERSRRRSTQVAFRQKIRLEKEKEIAKQNESIVLNAPEMAAPIVQAAPAQQIAPTAGESVELEQMKPQQSAPEQQNPSQQEPPSEMESSQLQQTQPDSQMQQPPSQVQPKVQQDQRLQVQIEGLKTIAPDPTSLPTSTASMRSEISTIPLTLTATERNPDQSKVDRSTSQSLPNTRLEDHSALWGMSLKPLTEDTANPLSNQNREIEASVEAGRDGILDMYSYHRGREGMEPRDPDSGEILAASIPTDTNHNFDAQKLLATIIVEFPLEDYDMDTIATSTGEESSVAMFKETLQWDLDDSATPSPAEFANKISEEYGLSFGQMMDLASSIQGQIDAHIRQSCNYCAPVAISDPTGNERRFNAVVRQAQPYDYLVRGDGGGVLISRKRTQKHQLPFPFPSKPKAQSISAIPTTDTTSNKSGSRKGPKKGYIKQVIEVDEDVEDVYSEEIQKRVMQASKQRILTTPTGEKSGLLELKKNFHCHICHKKSDLTYTFACGIGNHVYCLVHCKNRLGLDFDVEKPAYLDYCPICALSCDCASCSRRLKNVAYDFKKHCTEQNAEPCKVFFPNVLEKCQNTSATASTRRTFKVIGIAPDTTERSVSKKSGQAASKSTDAVNKQPRPSVPKPSLLDFPREVCGAVDIDVGHPDDYMTVYSCDGSFRAHSVPDVWEKEQQRALELENEQKTSDSLSQEIVVSNCEEVVEDGNVDYCHMCGKAGNIICCDFCPRTFHQACMDNRAVSGEDDGDQKWECPVCKSEKVGLPSDLVDGTAHHEMIISSIEDNDDLKKDENGLRVFAIIYEMVNKLMVYDFGIIFQKPVQGEKGYRKIVKHPMDLGTIRTKVKNGWYIDAKAISFDAAIAAALKDVELVWHNCFLYNALDSAVYRMAGVLRRRALGIRKKSFDHLLSDGVKSTVGEYVTLCERGRLQLLLTQRPKNIAESKALQAKQPKGKYKMFVNSKHAKTKKVAILDPSTGRILKTYSSVKNAVVAYSHLAKLGHECEWTEPDVAKLINRSTHDSKCLIFGYRWLPLDDLRALKVKFRKKAPASASTILEMNYENCRYLFLSIEHALSYFFLSPGVEMSEARSQLKRVPAGTDYVELFGVGWRRPLFEGLNPEKGGTGTSETVSFENQQQSLLVDCSVVKMDSCTRRTMMAFGTETAAFEDWKRANSASPLSTRPSSEDLEHFKKEYLEGLRHVDGMVWRRCNVTERNEGQPKPAEKDAVPVSTGEASTDAAKDTVEPQKNEEKDKNAEQSKKEQTGASSAAASSGHSLESPTTLGKRKQDSDGEQQTEPKKQACDDREAMDRC